MGGNSLWMTEKGYGFPQNRIMPEIDISKGGEYDGAFQGRKRTIYIREIFWKYPAKERETRKKKTKTDPFAR